MLFVLKSKHREVEAEYKRQISVLQAENKLLYKRVNNMEKYLGEKSRRDSRGRFL